MNTDVMIIGAGPAGLSFARSLADTGLKAVVVEKFSAGLLANPLIDGRDIALTHLSKGILERLGVWERIPEAEISLIRAAKVLDGDSPYALHFDHQKVSDDALGYLIPNYLIRKAVYEEVITLPDVDLITEVTADTVRTDAGMATVTLSDGQTITSKLLVAADSRFSQCRRAMGISASMLDFGRVVIVCRMEHEQGHNGVAHECFNYGETLAVLPLSGNSSSIVITLPTSRSEETLSMDPESFSARVQSNFGNRLGQMKLVGERYPYPLVAVYANKFVATRFALIGDAAVGMHPVTAHGFNLGLRGQDTLTMEIRAALARGRDIGSSSLLQRYQAKHRRVTRPLYVGTNALVRLYTDDRPLHKVIRKAVLRFGGALPPVKQAIVNQLTEIQN